MKQENCYDKMYIAILTLFVEAGKQGRKDIVNVCNKLFDDPHIKAAEERESARIKSM